MKKIVIVYDNWCPNCTRFSNSVKKIDWLGLVEHLPLRNLPQGVNPDIDKALKLMAGTTGNGWTYGFSTIYKIIARLPLFWLVLPIFWILRVTSFGSYLYQQLAVNRNIIPIHCDDNCKI